MALPYARGREFPEAKSAGVPCRHLGGDFGCGIHVDLLAGGWRGCVTFDCVGAGPLVIQQTYTGRSWRDDTVDPVEQFEVFEVMRGIQELRFLLADPACRGSSYAGETGRLAQELRGLAGGPPAVVRDADLGQLRARAGALFGQVAAERGGVSHRGALLIAADLRGRDLADADLLGADLRDADLRGADLSRSLFLTQAQVNAARGDLRTRLPERLGRPAHWVAAEVGHE